MMNAQPGKDELDRRRTAARRTAVKLALLALFIFALFMMAGITGR